MRSTWLIVAAVAACCAAAACGSKRSTSSARGEDARPVPASLDAAPAAVVLDSPEALWRAFQIVHDRSMDVDVETVGERLDALLSSEARTIVADAAEQATGALPTTIPIHGAEVRFKLLGELVRTRAARVRGATVEIAMIDAEHAELRARGPAGPLTLPAVREGGAWRLGPSPELLPAEEDVFSLPPGAAAPAGADTVEAVADAWVAALNGGNGWDAYNLLAPSNRARLKEMVARMGGSGDEDVVRILDKTLRDRRARGITASAPTIEAGGDRRKVEVRYSNGNGDRFEAVREEGRWWMVMPM